MGALVGRDGEGSLGRAKQGRKGTGREISRLMLPEFEQREMKLVTGWWMHRLIVFFIHLFLHPFNHACLNALVNSTNAHPGP